jgi:hypothetical protein
VSARSHSSLRPSEQGQATIEFALVVPVLLLLLVGISDLGRALNAYVTVTNASREGARFAIANVSATEAQIVDEVARRARPLDPALLDVEVAYYAADGSLQLYPVPASDPPVPVLIRVDSRYPWSAASWVVGRFFAGGTGSQTFSGTSTMETWR